MCGIKWFWWNKMRWVVHGLSEKLENPSNISVFAICGSGKGSKFADIFCNEKLQFTKGTLSDGVWEATAMPVDLTWIFFLKWLYMLKTR